MWFTTGDYIGRITPQGKILKGFLLPQHSDAADIATGPRSSAWFAEQGGDRIGRIASNGNITEFVILKGTIPLGIREGSDGNLWFTVSSGGFIGRITPRGIITEFPLPNPNSGPYGITAGPDG